MSAPAWSQVKDLLHQALALAPGPRAQFLDEVCASNAPLRAELDSLLSVGDALSAEFLQSPPEFREAAGVLNAGVMEWGAAGLAPGQLFADRFRLIRKLGEGGMGQVWLAEQSVPVRRSVALKLIKAGIYDEAVVRRFRSERQSLAIMDHPAIAKVFDAGATPQGQPYLVMEYVPGLPITEYCDQRKLKIRERLELFIRACEGVQHAHQKAIIHRDLKPDNILIVEVDGEPRPRIIDFGLAKGTTVHLAEETLHTRFGQFLGTPGYMSPEQVDPNIQDIDTRTDVYSLGVILYVLLTGRQPFENQRRAKAPLDVWLRQLREEEPPSPSAKLSGDWDSAHAASAARGTEPRQLASELKGDLDWIVMKALERDRERRYGTPAELATDLRRSLNHEPVTARPASAAYQLRKFIRRHRAAAAVAGVVAGLAIVASGAALVAIRQKREAEYQVTQVRQAQSNLLTQAALQHLKDADVAGAQSLILEVLTNPNFRGTTGSAAINAFQDIRAADTQLAVLSGHSATVSSAVYSPDGARIVSSSFDKTARVWDARTGMQLAVLMGHDPIYSADFSPDGTRIATASADRTVRIWDAGSGKQIAALTGHDGKVTAAAFSADGDRILTASTDATARIWDARSGVLLTVLAGHGDYLNSAAFSPDGTRVVTASNDKTVRIWDARTGQERARLRGSDMAFFSAAYSPDGSRIVAASTDKTARVWDAHTGSLVAVLSGHGDYLNSAFYSPDGNRIVTASADRTVRLWDAHSGVPLAVLSGHSGAVLDAVYSPDGTRILTASNDKTVRIWDARSGAQMVSLLGHDDRLTRAGYSPDGTRVVTASIDDTARIWDAATGQPVRLLSGHTGFVYSAAFSRDGTQIVTASADRTARCWDARTGIQRLVLSGHEAEVYGAAFSPDGSHIVTASEDRTARLWDAHTGAQLAVLSGHGEAVRSAAYSPDGERIVTGSDDRTVRVWDARTQNQALVLYGHSDRVLSADYSPNAATIVTASLDGTARLWDARNGSPLLLLAGQGARVNTAAYSPDGTRVVTASHDRAARIWDARTGIQLAVLIGHGDNVKSAVYSPDGARIVTASDDHSARIWDASVQATLDAQILWYAAAETTYLAADDRTRLGVPLDADAKRWPVMASACDEAAAAPYDPERERPGVLTEDMTAAIAEAACSKEVRQSQQVARSQYQWGRALVAKGDARGAGEQFNAAMARGYRAAQVDLADLLVQSAATVADAERAVALLQRAWRDGLAVAAFKLGRIYEHGIQGNDPAMVMLEPDATLAEQWYRRALDAGEPGALARLAGRAEKQALATEEPAKRDALLLQAFKFYAVASQYAKREDWPDRAWKDWRYRRATLARLLARDGMMQQVADTYAAILRPSDRR